MVRVASHTVAHIAVFSFRVAFDGAHGMAVKVHDRLSGANDASAMGLLAATLHTVAHIAVFRFHVAFDRTVDGDEGARQSEWCDRSLCDWLAFGHSAR